MNGFSKDYLRQIEILASCLNGSEYSKADYAAYYKVSEITINRDLEALRENGIQIFSRKGKVMVTEKPAKDLLQYLVSDYLPVKLNSDVFLKQLRTLARKKNNYFPILTLLAKAVSEGAIVIINYQRFYDNEVHTYELKSIRLYVNEMDWIFNGIKKDESLIKTFYVSRIMKLQLTNKKYKKVDIPLTNKNSYKMTFRFSHEVADEVMDKIWFDNFEDPYEDEDGYIILKTEQPITNKLAAWCISWWDKIIIDEPIELREFTVNMIRSYLLSNDSD